MLKEYFYAYEDKYNAAGDLGAGLVLGAEYAACFKPGGGYERGGYADYCSCYENITSIRAKVMPTAKASMLVATARSSMDLKPKEVSVFSSSFFMPS